MRPMEFVLLNFAYGLNLLALVVKDVLWLRAVLLPAQLSFLAWGLAQALPATIAWNGIFIVINAVQIARIARERRPIQLPLDILDLYQNVFVSMKPREFLLFWETGNVQEAREEAFVRQGQELDALLFIVTGKARVVSRDGNVLAILGRGSFAGELSFLSGDPASADVVAEGKVTYNSWDHQKLRRLEKINAELFTKLQGILGRDMTDKIRVASSRIEATAEQTIPG
jgi:CRP-like cAMP-binding protein